MWISNADKSIQMYANQFSCIIMFKYSWIVKKAFLVDKCYFFFIKLLKRIISVLFTIFLKFYDWLRNYRLAIQYSYLIAKCLCTSIALFRDVTTFSSLSLYSLVSVLTILSSSSFNAALVIS